MTEKRNFSGRMIGTPFLASIDRDGTRKDRENCALVASGFHVAPGYRAYLFDDSYPEEYMKNLAGYCPDASIVYGLTETEYLHNYDVIEVDDRGRVFRVYSDTSGDNVLFITNQCNSNCIMCPDSDFNRKRENHGRAQYLQRLIQLIPSDVGHLTITGGEPTLMKWEFIDLLQQCKECFDGTEFLMLSNGRTLCVKEYRDAFLSAVPSRFCLAVPLYGTTSEAHDSITRSPGGFVQTIEALKLLQHHIDIEIRIVIMSLNYQYLPEIASFIVEHLPRTKTVSLMGLELLGNAAMRRDELWVDFKDTAPAIETAVHTLISAGIEARIYNYPLCSLPRRLWSIAEKSITDYKVRYKPECENCAVQHICGGFFYSTITYDRVSVSPILEDKSHEE